MRAVGLSEFGGPERLQVVEVPDLHAGPGEVRIRVRAASVNPADVLFVAGVASAALGDRRPPYTPGADAAGEIDEVGDGSPWHVGDRVIAMAQPRGPHGGAYAEQVVVPAGAVASAPTGVDLAAASTLPLNGLTARLALDLLALTRGQTLAVLGAAGAVGGYLVQLAKADGLRVVADAAAEDEDVVRQMGADHVVARGDGVAERIREAMPGGVDGLADTTLIDEEAIPAIRDGGGLAVFRGWPGEADRGITVHRPMVATYATNQAALDRLSRQVENGEIGLRVAQMFTPEQSPEALRRMAAGGVRGRFVIEF